MMNRATFFLRPCPTCGRKLQIRVHYLGKSVTCRHCKATFNASDPGMSRAAEADPILERVDRLLAVKLSSDSLN